MTADPKPELPISNLLLDRVAELGHHAIMAYAVMKAFADKAGTGETQADADLVARFSGMSARKATGAIETLLAAGWLEPGSAEGHVWVCERFEFSDGAAGVFEFVWRFVSVRSTMRVLDLVQARLRAADPAWLGSTVVIELEGTSVRVTHRPKLH